MRTPQSTIEPNGWIPESDAMTKRPAPSTRPVLLLIGIVLVLLTSACGGGADPESAAATPVAEADGSSTPATGERPSVEADTVATALVAHFDGLTGTNGEAISAEEADALRTSVIELLVPDGVDPDDPVAVAEALAGRLGGEYAGETDPDVLIEALIAELAAEGGDITTVGDLLAAIESWATGDVIVIGSHASGASIGAGASFADAVALLETTRPAIDLIPGLMPIEVRDVDIDVDHGDRRITITGRIPAPVAGQARVTIDFAGGAPELALTIDGDALRLDDLTTLPLGELGGIGFDAPTLTVAADGVTVAAQADPSVIPGASEAGVPAGNVPITVALPSLGAFGAPAAEVAFDIEIPFEDLGRFGDWHTRRDALLTLSVGDVSGARWGEVWDVRIGDSELRFAGEIAVRSSGASELTMSLAGPWTRPFGFDWMSVDGLTVSAERSSERTTARFAGDFEVGGKEGRLEFAVASGRTGTSTEVTGSLADLTVDDLITLAREVAGAELVPRTVTVPDGLFSMSDVTVSFSSGQSTSFTISGRADVLGRQADALFGFVPARGGGTTSIVAVTPRNLVLSDLLPVLSDEPTVGGVEIPEAAIVLTGESVDATAGELPVGVRSFMGASLGDVSHLRLGGGLNLAGSIPGGVAPAIDDVKEALGMDRGAPIHIGGSLPIGALTGGPATDFELNATLPEMNPAGSPSWFVSAELGLRITGQPSVGVVGRMTLDIGGDVQAFEVEASVGGGATGASMQIVGRLDGAWETPFDIEWLTLNEVVLKLGIEPRGVTIGFLADLQVGSKDIRGGMAITVSPAGVPTNFVFEAESEAGVSMGDLADLYALMSGEARPPVERALPAAEVRSLALRFAPQGDPDLGIKQGFRIAGELWMGSRPGAPLELLVGVDIEIADSGIAIDGYLTDWAIGPIAFDEASLSITVSAFEQRFAISGGVELFDQGIWADVEFTPTEYSFGGRIVVIGGEASLRVTASFDLIDPDLRVSAAMDEQFLRNVDAALEATLGRQVTDLNRTVSDGRRDVNRLRPLVSSARDAVSDARSAVNLTGCGWPFGYLCDALRAAENTLARYERQLADAERRLAQAEALLEKYDIQLTPVGAEFTSDWAGTDAGTVEMILVIDANGFRHEVGIDWDFNKSLDDNLDGILEELI